MEGLDFTGRTPMIWSEATARRTSNRRPEANTVSGLKTSESPNCELPPLPSNQPSPPPSLPLRPYTVFHPPHVTPPSPSRTIHTHQPAPTPSSTPPLLPHVHSSFSSANTPSTSLPTSIQIPPPLPSTPSPPPPCL